MSKISSSQLIKNIANTYRNTTGSSELVAIGELTDKLADAMNNTGSNIVRPTTTRVSSQAIALLPQVVTANVIARKGNTLTQSSIPPVYDPTYIVTSIQLLKSAASTSSSIMLGE